MEKALNQKTLVLVVPLPLALYLQASHLIFLGTALLFVKQRKECHDPLLVKEGNI